MSFGYLGWNNNRTLFYRLAPCHGKCNINCFLFFHKENLSSTVRYFVYSDNSDVIRYGESSIKRLLMHKKVYTMDWLVHGNTKPLKNTFFNTCTTCFSWFCSLCLNFASIGFVVLWLKIPENFQNVVNEIPIYLFIALCAPCLCLSTVSVNEDKD